MHARAVCRHRRRRLFLAGRQRVLCKPENHPKLDPRIGENRCGRPYRFKGLPDLPNPSALILNNPGPI